jgi:hypothetical protein
MENKYKKRVWTGYSGHEPEINPWKANHKK